MSHYSDGLVQVCSNSIANALELLTVVLHQAIDMNITL